MRRTILSFLFALLLFSLSFAQMRYRSYLALQKQSFLEESSFLPTSLPTQNRPFVLVVVGYNNGATVEKTLRSIFEQIYEEYRVIYIDDGSDNGSFEVARDCIYGSEQIGKVTLLQNEKKLGVLSCLYNAIHSCKEEEIVLVLRQEESLAHEWVLQRLNAHFANPRLWLAFGLYVDSVRLEKGAPLILPKTAFRQQFPATLHIPVFYAALFNKVKLEDFKQNGSFVTQAFELCYLLPMLEMSQGHESCLKEPIVISALAKREKEDLLQIRSEKWIRSLPSYTPLITCWERSLWEE